VLDLAPQGQEGTATAAMQLGDRIGTAFGAGIGGVLIGTARPAPARRYTTPPPDLTRYKVREIERSVFKPTVCLNVISLVASSCGYYRGHIEQHAAPEFTVYVATQGGRETSTTPPSAARSARGHHAGASLQRSTVAPEAWHCSGTTPPSGDTPVATHGRSNDFIASPAW